MTDQIKIEKTNSEGLLREYKVNLLAAHVNDTVTNKITEEAATFKMAGFREGKVPFPLVKSKIGPEVFRRTLQSLVNDVVQKAIEESGSRPSGKPEVSIPDHHSNESTVQLEKDLTIHVSFEVLPVMPDIDLPSIKIDSDEIEISESDMDRARKEILKKSRVMKKAPDDYKASEGDSIQIDCSGVIDGEQFDKAKVSGMDVSIGEGALIPGFESQLIGLGAGDTKTFSLDLPNDYPEHPGKSCEFTVRVLSVSKEERRDNWDDDFAKKMEVESVSQMDKMLRDKLSQEFAVMSRFQLKKEIFDFLDKQYEFEVPSKMVALDEESIIKDMEKNQSNGAIVEKDKANALAKRRVKLGLMLSEIARTNNVIVSEEDFKKIIELQMSQMPGREKEFIDFYSKPENLRMLEGPLLEEKTVDFILTKINLQKNPITFEEFNKKQVQVNQ